MWKKAFSFLLVCLTLLPWARALEGMDVSVYQGDIDFSAARSDGIETVYIRSSFGAGGVDARFQQNAQGAAQAGLPFGFYHYMEAATPEEARREARHFAQLIQQTDYSCRPALDFEVEQGLSDREASAVVRAFLEETQAILGQRPMLYVDRSRAGQLEPDLEEYPLWIALWSEEEPDLNGTPWSQWTGWQYTDRGRVAGVRGNVDRDVFTDAVRLDSREPGTGRTVTVRRGNTLWALARRYGTTVNTLVALNHIEDPDLIYVGQVLRLPRASQNTLYTVRWGDTLSAIARDYGVSVAQLVEQNQIADPNLIYVGQVLRI